MIFKVISKITFQSTLLNCKAWVKYFNLSCASKRDLRGSLGPTKVTYCSIHSGCILGTDDFVKNYKKSRPEPKKNDFFIQFMGSDVLMYGDEWISFFVYIFFYTVQSIEMKFKTYHYFNKLKCLVVFGTYRLINISILFRYIFSFF